MTLDIEGAHPIWSDAIGIAFLVNNATYLGYFIAVSSLMSQRS